MMVRSGSNRIVFLVGRYAIKLPRARSWRGLLYGWLNNLNEAETGPRAGACPVVLSLFGGLIIAMRRAREMTFDEFGHLLDVEEFKAKTGLEVEAKPDSFGWLDGDIVAVDYGVPCDVRW